MVLVHIIATEKIALPFILETLIHQIVHFSNVLSYLNKDPQVFDVCVLALAGFDGLLQLVLQFGRRDGLQHAQVLDLEHLVDLVGLAVADKVPSDVGALLQNLRVVGLVHQFLQNTKRTRTLF